MATAGALTYGELGAMYPKAGGNYVFLKEAYGPLLGFLYGMAYCLITSPGAIALLSIGFAEYVGLQNGTLPSILMSITVVLTLTFFNWRGVKLGAGVMNVLTMTKIGVMLLLVENTRSDPSRSALPWRSDLRSEQTRRSRGVGVQQC